MVIVKIKIQKLYTRLFFEDIFVSFLNIFSESTSEIEKYVVICKIHTSKNTDSSLWKKVPNSICLAAE